MSSNYTTSRMAGTTSANTSLYSDNLSNTSSGSSIGYLLTPSPSRQSHGQSAYVSGKVTSVSGIEFNANLEAELLFNCHEAEMVVGASGKNSYTRSHARTEQIEDTIGYMSDEEDDDIDEDMDDEYVDIPSSATSNPSADAAAATADAIASEEPSPLAKLAASAVWTMLTPRLNIPAPSSLKSLAQSLHFALEATQLPRVMTHLALFYLHRLLACADRADPVERQRFFEAASISNKLTGSHFSAYHRLFTVALALADAYLDDHAYAGSAWSQVAGDNQSRLWNRFHMQSLDIISWRLEVPNNDWVRWRSWLGDWWRAVGVTYWSTSGKGTSAKTTLAKSTSSSYAAPTTPVSPQSVVSATSTATLSPARTPVSASNFSLGTNSPLTPAKDKHLAYPTPSPVHLHPSYGQSSSRGSASAQPLLTPSSSFEDISSVKQASGGRSTHHYYSTPETPGRVNGNSGHDAGNVFDTAHYEYVKKARIDRGNTANEAPLMIKITSSSNPGYMCSPVRRRTSSVNSSNASAVYLAKAEHAMLPSPQPPQSQPQRYHYPANTGQLVTMEPHAFSYGSYYGR
ncbi:hypothetical protein BDF19DRAFT_420824 [Syncephalis fuscata]|nr:hypothetical protein BDF19DRAFT_420824 [Syncephalis fuscata]